LRTVLERDMPGDALPELSGLPDEISLHAGEEATVLLPSHAGAGYVWAAEVDDEAVAEASTQFEGADDAAVGQRTFSRNELLTLRGRSAGTTRVRLVQRRTWESDVEPIGAHILTVNVVADKEGATERGGTQ
jgi:predicted secreted protein